jgi:general secretion pathway protein G
MKIKAISPAHASHAAVSAFTLVEMLLVLVILGILAAIIYPNINDRGRDARIAATKTQITQLETCLNAFEVDNGYYPKGPNGLNELIERSSDAVDWHGPYVKHLPRDGWGREFSYQCPGKLNPSSYDLVSAGPDGVMGTEDDITNE